MNLLSMIQMIINALAKPIQHILITEIPKEKILDIGAGGEGVIAQIGGPSIIAIDKYMSEIREARGKSTDTAWMVTDGIKLPFANGCIDNATAFFSCMYMPEDVKENVFNETRRVLKNGGTFWIWDVNMPQKSKIFAIRLQVNIPNNHSIKTVYGVKAKEQSVDKICELLRESGFDSEVISNHKHWFFIKAISV